MVGIVCGILASFHLCVSDFLVFRNDVASGALSSFGWLQDSIWLEEVSGTISSHFLGNRARETTKL